MNVSLAVLATPSLLIGSLCTAGFTSLMHTSIKRNYDDIAFHNCHINGIQTFFTPAKILHIRML
jgi:hypothetical protein